MPEHARAPPGGPPPGVPPRVDLPAAIVAAAMLAAALGVRLPSVPAEVLRLAVDALKP